MATRLLEILNLSFFKYLAITIIFTIINQEATILIKTGLCLPLW